jgi:hypothetical protein
MDMAVMTTSWRQVKHVITSLIFAFLVSMSLQCAPLLANMVAIAQPLTHVTAAGQDTLEHTAKTQVRTPAALVVM